ncbi:hypothetical protein Y032_0046g1382 [Ancylostoma ceylanicum]|uniref:Uncharacterized protein n=1 Tax=Ancylostoma ceylanicum TaxID=53326 RepID=A0A016UDN5_9BILA|nr:hypothetical protein Y032_0046g1382 [Ancylostoma ceylanicum]
MATLETSYQKRQKLNLWRLRLQNVLFLRLLFPFVFHCITLPERTCCESDYSLVWNGCYNFGRSSECTTTCQCSLPDSNGYYICPVNTVFQSLRVSDERQPSRYSGDVVCLNLRGASRNRIISLVKTKY